MNGEIFKDCTQYVKPAATIKAITALTVFAFSVKIPAAKIPAIGTPNNPVTAKNKFHVSEVLPTNK